MAKKLGRKKRRKRRRIRSPLRPHHRKAAQAAAEKAAGEFPAGNHAQIFARTKTILRGVYGRGNKEANVAALLVMLEVTIPIIRDIIRRRKEIT